MNREEQWLLDEKYHGVEGESFFADCVRLKNGEPLAYVIGSIPFLGCTIFLNSHPLIPRPETEFWVEKAVVAIQDSKIANPKILDLCSGSGCIGIAVLKHIPTAIVDFSDVVVHHYSTVNRTIVVNAIDASRVRCHTGDLFSAMESSTQNKKYDFILSNPPYIDEKLNRTEKSVTNYEPHEALFANHNGLEIIERIIAQAQIHLNENGKLYIEHEPEQVIAIHTLAEKNNLIAVTHNDQYNVSRYTTFTV